MNKRDKDEDLIGVTFTTHIPRRKIALIWGDAPREIPKSKTLSYHKTRMYFV